MVAKPDPATLGRVRLESRRVADLLTADYNPRTISDQALAGLGASIGRYGLVQPIIVNARTGRVVGGHQRLKVLQAKGVEATDVLVIDVEEAEEKALTFTGMPPGTMMRCERTSSPRVRPRRADAWTEPLRTTVLEPLRPRLPVATTAVVFRRRTARDLHVALDAVLPRVRRAVAAPLTDDADLLRSQVEEQADREEKHEQNRVHGPVAGIDGHLAMPAGRAVEVPHLHRAHLPRRGLGASTDAFATDLELVPSAHRFHHAGQQTVNL